MKACEIFADCEPIDFKLTDEQLGITPAIYARSERRRTTPDKVARRIRRRRQA